MTGDFALTLPVMLAVAIASTVSRAISYGTIYTTKLLRRGTDIDRTTLWRALQDLKIADAMRPFRPLSVPPCNTADGDGPAPELGPPGRASYLPAGPAVRVRDRVKAAQPRLPGQPRRRTSSSISGANRRRGQGPHCCQVSRSPRRVVHAAHAGSGRR